MKPYYTFLIGKKILRQIINELDCGMHSNAALSGTDSA
jgi:hypothetical protein